MSSSNVVRLSVALLLLALCIQVLASVCTTSPTFDEPYHILRSYAYLKTGDSALLAQGGHPPLANMLSVLPLLLRSDLALPAHQPGWPDVGSFRDLFRVADEFLWHLGNDADSIILRARLPTILLSALLAGLVFSWAKQLHGVSAGLLALFLYAFDPNILAHSGLVTTDLGATFFVFASVYCLWRFCQRPSWSRLMLTGVAFGLAQATKFSALSLAPIFILLLLVWVFGMAGPALPFSLPAQGWLAKRPRLQRVYLVLGLCVVIFAIGLVVLWAVYGFEVRPLLPHEDSHPLLDRWIPGDHPGIRRVVYVLTEDMPIPAPAYFAEMAWLRRYTQAGHASFLMGQYTVKGWWFYFPVALAIKTPIPLLILLLAAITRSFTHKEELRKEYFLLIPMALFFATSMFSSIDIGYRNILPMLPLAFVYVSKLAGWAAKTLRVSETLRVCLALLCVWYVLGTLTLSPHYLAYFNEFVGGPDSGYKYLVDSNLDWGQDLKPLKKYLDAQGILQIYLDYFGTADPTYYGIVSLPMPDRPPASDAPSAYYAISATSLQNVYGQGATSTHWLKQYQPVDKVGYSIFVYRLP